MGRFNSSKVSFLCIPSLFNDAVSRSDNAANYTTIN